MSSFRTVQARIFVNRIEWKNSMRLYIFRYSSVYSYRSCSSDTNLWKQSLKTVRRSPSSF